MKTKIRLPTLNGEITFSAYKYQDQEILVARNLSKKEPIFLRIHSSCVFSESFHTIDCDCSRQLDSALKYISKEGGIIIYLYQEGRGLGLIKKIEAINLEHKLGHNTVEAFEALGHEPDPRSYEVVIEILNKLGIKEVVLNTSNPNKVKALEDADIKVIKHIKLKIESNELIENYLEAKRCCLGHHE